jgi:hypothetical protein
MTRSAQHDMHCTLLSLRTKTTCTATAQHASRGQRPSWHSSVHPTQVHCVILGDRHRTTTVLLSTLSVAAGVSSRITCTKVWHTHMNQYISSAYADWGLGYLGTQQTIVVKCHPEADAAACISLHQTLITIPATQTARTSVSLACMWLSVPVHVRIVKQRYQ